MAAGGPWPLPSVAWHRQEARGARPRTLDKARRGRRPPCRRCFFYGHRRPDQAPLVCCKAPLAPGRRRDGSPPDGQERHLVKDGPRAGRAQQVLLPRPDAAAWGDLAAASSSRQGPMPCVWGWLIRDVAGLPRTRLGGWGRGSHGQACRDDVGLAGHDSALAGAPLRDAPRAVATPCRTGALQRRASGGGGGPWWLAAPPAATRAGAVGEQQLGPSQGSTRMPVQCLQGCKRQKID